MLNNGFNLRPCPFCGSDEAVDFETIKEAECCVNYECEDECPAFRFDDCLGKRIICSILKGGCGASSGFAWSDERAVELWNRRAGNEK